MKTNKTLIWLLVALLLVGAAVGLYVYQTQPARAEAARTFTVKRVSFTDEPDGESFYDQPAL